MLATSAPYGLRVCCYDISNDKRRRLVIRELESYGVRVQESVFECWIDDDQCRSLLLKLRRVIQVTEDSVALYSLGTGCEDVPLLGCKTSADITYLVI